MTSVMVTALQLLLLLMVYVPNMTLQSMTDLPQTCRQNSQWQFFTGAEDLHPGWQNATAVTLMHEAPFYIMGMRS